MTIRTPLALRQSLLALLVSASLAACGGGGSPDGAADPAAPGSANPGTGSPGTTNPGTSNPGAGGGTGQPTAGAATDLCAGLVTDKLNHPMTQVAKPAYLGSYVDPNFRTTVRRITDAVAQFGADTAAPVYSTMPAWNADESLLLLYVPGQGHVLLNGKTYALVRRISFGAADIEHLAWSATDPDALFLPSGNKLEVYKPSTNTFTTVHTFPSSVSFGGDPIYGDWASNLFGFKTGTSTMPLLYTRSSNSVRNGAIQATPKISSSGTYIVQDQSVYRASDLSFVRTMTIDATQHGATGRTAAGRDFWASVQFDLPSGQNGNLVVQYFDTGEVRNVVGESNGWGYPRNGSHLSAHAFKNPGWVAMSMTGEVTGQVYLDQEIALANVATGVVCRVAHHRSGSQNGVNGYWSEPHVNISPSGTRMIFGSDWYQGNSIDTYVVELPSYRP